jgi:hypothetical protein
MEFFKLHAWNLKRKVWFLCVRQWVISNNLIIVKSKIQSFCLLILVCWKKIIVFNWWINLIYFLHRNGIYYSHRIFIITYDNIPKKFHCYHNKFFNLIKLFSIGDNDILLLVLFKKTTFYIKNWFNKIIWSRISC